MHLALHLLFVACLSTHGWVSLWLMRRAAGRRCLLALAAQFYPKKWPGQWWVMLVCVLAYGACTLALNLFITRVEGDVFLFTRPRKVRASCAGSAASQKQGPVSEVAIQLANKTGLVSPRAEVLMLLHSANPLM